MRIDSKVAQLLVAGATTTLLLRKVVKCGSPDDDKKLFSVEDQDDEASCVVDTKRSDRLISEPLRDRNDVQWRGEWVVKPWSQ